MRNVCLLLIVLVLFTCGCYSLRKKFSRNKAHPKETQVYLDLKSYPVSASREDYQDGVLYLNGWLDEAVSNLIENGNRKRVRHSLQEALESMDEIVDFYDEDGKRAIGPLHEELRIVRDDFAHNANLTTIDCNGFKRRIEEIKRSFSENFKYSEAKKWLR